MAYGMEYIIHVYTPYDAWMAIGYVRLGLIFRILLEAAIGKAYVQYYMKSACFFLGNFLFVDVGGGLLACIGMNSS